MLPNGSSDSEKIYAINSILNAEFFSKIENGFFSKNYYSSKRCHITVSDTEKFEYFYKFRAIFKDDLTQTQFLPFSIAHSMLASLILDYPKVEYEDVIITNLRENYNKIIEFSKDNSLSEIVIENCDLKYQKKYAQMLRHILISDIRLPKNIDVDSINRKTGSLTYTIRKK